MQRGIHRLTAPQVRNATAAGLLHDGGGLYLQVIARPEKDGQPAGVTRSWLLRYTAPSGKRREMGLGSAEEISLADARTAAEAAKKFARAGIDPIEQRKTDRAAAASEAARAITFRQAADAYMKARAASWRSEKHAKLWAASLERYVHPTLGSLRVAAIDVALVLKVLEPIWEAKPETAARVRQRIEAVLDWAAARGYRSKENPARWREHMQHLLPARSQPVKHHAALPYSELPGFMSKLRGGAGNGARALELLILTATRSSETRLARWREFTLEAPHGSLAPLNVWSIVAERMKARREHRVPLTPAVLAILKTQRELYPNAKQDDLVFPGAKKGRPLSDMTLLKVLERMGRGDLTAHGFRSTFRDWAAERTAFPREVAEAALAHAIGDKVEAAYRRGDLFEKRRRLMEAWAGYCASPAKGGQVVALKTTS